MARLSAFLLRLLVLVVGSAAVPIDLFEREASLVLSSISLTKIAPQSSTCAGAPYPNECRTASSALGPIVASFKTYGVTSRAEMAALIAIMAYETAGFKYQNNYYPGRPGQGTRNMQSASFNLLYAKSIPALTASVTGITGGLAAGALSSEQLNQVRALLTSNDNYDFASAAWFLTTQCSAGVRAQLQTGTFKGWQSYIVDCVGTSTAGRQAVWETAMQVIGG
ncbi:hypothetical protein MMC13_008393 [Lambiella insularis]|nr:hypothetical protein [Lambiella insularis]